MLSKEGKIGLVVCTISVVMLGLAPTQRKRSPILGSQFKLVFHACKGLRPSDPVVVGGVPAGRVINLDFAPESDWIKLNPPGDERPVVLVTVALEQGFKLTAGTGYKVVSTLRGAHFINILPPPPGQRGLPAGSILNEELRSESDDSLMVTIRGFKELAQRTKDMRAQFADPVFRRDVKDLASNMRFYSSEFVRVSQDSQAGNEGADSMMVMVLLTTGAPHGTGPGGGALVLSFANPISAGSPIDLAYRAPAGWELEIKVYDTAGRQVRTIVEGVHPGGERRITWDLADSGGRRVAAGVYLISLQAGGQVVTQKAVITR